VRGLLALALLLPSAAAAHKMAPAFLGLQESAAGEVQLVLKAPRVGGRFAAIRAHLPAGCAAGRTPTQQRTPQALITQWSMTCPDGLAGQALRFEGLGGSVSQLIVNWRRPDGGDWTGVAPAGAPSVTLPATLAEGDVAVGAYLGLGVRHILEGLDHLLFVLGLLLLVARRQVLPALAGGPWKTLLGTITAFTAAHSITLSAAALGHAALRPGPVELVIALSILLLAVELGRSTPELTLTVRKPWVVAFAFGLLHGFGFAGALGEIGLPQGAAAGALLLFNVGVELGQLMFVAAAVVAWALVRRLRVPRLLVWAERGAIYTMGAAATFWCAQRFTELWG
jgi:hypothetical protein